MKIKIISKMTKKILFKLEIETLKWNINDLEMIIIKKIFIFVHLWIITWEIKIENFDKKFIDTFKKEIKIFDFFKKNPNDWLITFRKILKEKQLEKFDKEFILDILKL